MAYASVNDLFARWRPLTPDEAARAETLLDDAALWLRVWVPGLAVAVAGGGDVAKAAKILSVAMVKRAMQAEDTDRPGVQAFQETAGIYSEQVTYRNPEGNLYLYDRERSDLLTLVTGLPSGAVSMTSPGL